VDWHQADLSKLFEQIRERFPASEPKAEFLLKPLEFDVDFSGGVPAVAGTAHPADEIFGLEVPVDVDRRGNGGVPRELPREREVAPVCTAR
jgi:hypothetical protein